MKTLAPFVAGFLTMGYAVAALFFARFWRQNRDRLFAMFAAAFVLLCMQQVISVFGERTVVAYVVRLLAFLVLLGGVVDRNLRE